MKIQKKYLYSSVSVVLALSIAGCSAKELPQIKAQHYPQCIKPLVAMQEADNRLAQTTAQSALGGALAGAVIGLIATASNPYAIPVGLGIGAAAGAATGAAVGYSFAKLEQISDENTRFASIRITANQDLTKANRLQLYSYECLVCYIREFDALQAAYQNGSLTREEYNDKFAEILSAMKELGKIIGKMDAELSRTEQEFNSSLSRTQHLTPVPVETAQPPRTVRSTQQIFNHLAESRSKTQATQERNDIDLTAMLEECAGKVTPPKQDVQSIQQNYSRGYAETRQQVDSLRASHRDALEIMSNAAIQAGIDTV